MSNEHARKFAKQLAFLTGREVKIIEMSGVGTSPFGDDPDVEFPLNDLSPGIVSRMMASNRGLTYDDELGEFVPKERT